MIDFEYACEKPSDSSSREYPLVVGLTTLPSRIDKIRQTLDSLCNQSLTPDEIFLSLPIRSKREGKRYSVPKWLEEYNERVTIVRCATDFGPGTKLLGCIPHLPSTGCLVIVDDDMIYKPRMLEHIYQAQRRNHKASFSFYVYSIGLFKFGQGADGFSFHIPNLKGIERFADCVLKNPNLYVTDDQWISYFLINKKIKIESLAHLLPKGELIYDNAHVDNQLSDEESIPERSYAIAEGTRYIFQTRLLLPQVRFKYYLNNILDRIRKLKNVTPYLKSVNK